VTRYVIDTNLYVEAIRSDEANAALAAFQRRFAPLLHQHSTVAQELLAGAQDEALHRRYHEIWVEPFEDLGRVITRNGRDFDVIRQVEPRLATEAPWPGA
jgi:hypothetical protein